MAEVRGAPRAPDELPPRLGGFGGSRSEAGAAWSWRRSCGSRGCSAAWSSAARWRSHLIVTRTHPAIPGVAERVHEGLLGWDAGWYETIARVGYVPLGHQAVRFFPLFPIVSRLVAQVSGVTDGIAVVFIANLSALIASMALVALVRNDCGDGALAKRTAW